ncbi:uncharacterized protein LOC132046947 isoform X3 [Lycium ferocissimum]|uniref:uncharacterized protein LOC132046947 isoform X3 n=1 Tax=Lycium ferocissimum TaxID=112874 RepID=UPI0028157C9C|nr:uncharacterized protein LOC132046947 isoform X3 [Lycium ferocissimum]
MHGLIQVFRDTKKILVELKKHGKKVDEIHSMMRNMSLMGSGNSIRLTNSNGSEVPQVPDSVIGFEVPLQEFKLKLLGEKDQVVVLSAPTGCGKTTLEPMVCQEDDIKGYPSLSPEVEEGTCQVLAHIWLDSEIIAGSGSSSTSASSSASSSSSISSKKGNCSEFEKKLGDFFKHQLNQIPQQLMGMDLEEVC